MKWIFWDSGLLAADWLMYVHVICKEGILHINLPLSLPGVFINLKNWIITLGCLVRSNALALSVRWGGHLGASHLLCPADCGIPPLVIGCLSDRFWKTLLAAYLTQLSGRIQSSVLSVHRGILERSGPERFLNEGKRKKDPGDEK